MTTVQGFRFSGRIRSFVHAGRGIRTMLASQHNAWIHGFATLVVEVSPCGPDIWIFRHPACEEAGF